MQQASDVGVLLQLANQFKVPVTARGAGSSATGSSVPLRGGWALDLSALDSIRIDAVARIATVGEQQKGSFWKTYKLLGGRGILV